MGMHIAEGHKPEELRDALGLSLKDALELDEGDPSGAAAVLYAPIVEMLRHASPELAAAIEWLLSNEPAALMELPLTPVLVDALQGDTALRSALQLRFVHLVDLGGFGFCAFLMWDTDARLNREQRTALAGYTRRLADTAIAPWNRYRDLKRRREAFAVWVRQLRDERLQAEPLAESLRRQRPDDYIGEPLATTVKRIYRISSDLASVQFPREFAKMAREVETSHADRERDATSPE